MYNKPPFIQNLEMMHALKKENERLVRENLILRMENSELKIGVEERDHSIAFLEDQNKCQWRAASKRKTI